MLHISHLRCYKYITCTYECQQESEIFLTSLLNHWNVTCAELPAGVPAAVQIRAPGIIAPVVKDIAQAVADRFAGLYVHVCVLPAIGLSPEYAALPV